MITRRSRATRAHTHVYQSPAGLPNAGLPSNLITFSAPLVFWKIRAIDCDARQSLNVKLYAHNYNCAGRLALLWKLKEERKRFNFLFRSIRQLRQNHICGKISHVSRMSVNNIIVSRVTIF